MNVEFLSDNVIMNLSIIVSFILFSFLFFLFGVSIIGSFIKRKHKGFDVNPRVTVLIPCYNEAKNILKCLKSIVDCDYDKEKLEVIVIDDGSQDHTTELVQKFISSNPLVDMRLVKGQHKGKSEALNLGLKEAKHDLIFTVDADIFIRNDTIAKLVKPLRNKNVGASNSVVHIKKPTTLLEHFQRVEYAFNNMIRVSFSRVFKNSVWFFGAIACYRKSALQKVGGFKKDALTEDMDICLELYLNNYKIVTTNAVVYTNPMSSVIELFKQRMRWYYGALQALFKNRKLLKKFSPEVLFLFFNQYWWLIFAFIFFPMTIYQVFYWLPAKEEIAMYLFRWFSLSGPFYVLYKMPEWGLSFLNIFGIMSGIITFIISLFALKKFRLKWSLFTPLILFFYFPYTILLNLIMVSSVFRYRFSKKKYFIN